MTGPIQNTEAEDQIPVATPARKRSAPPSSVEVLGDKDETDNGSSAKKVKPLEPATSTLQSHAAKTADDPPVQKPGDGTVQTGMPDQVAAPRLPKLIGGMTQRQAWLSQGLKTKLVHGCFFTANFETSYIWVGVLSCCEDITSTALARSISHMRLTDHITTHGSCLWYVLECCMLGPWSLTFGGLRKPVLIEWLNHMEKELGWMFLSGSVTSGELGGRMTLQIFFASAISPRIPYLVV